MNANIEHTVNQCATCFKYQQMQPHERVLHYKIQCRPWKVVGADIFMTNAKTHLCLVDYHSKFPIVKKVNSLSVDDLVQMAKLIFAEYGQKKIVPGAGTTFMAGTFKPFCRRMNIQKCIASLYHHQSNRQVDTSIKFVKCTIKCFDTK